MSGFPEYDKKSRFPKLQPKGICRGCRGPIKQFGRITWCSQECKEKFDPFYVKQNVRKRCGEKCETCGKDCSREAQRNYSAHYPKLPDYRDDCKLGYPYNYDDFKNHPLYKAWEKAHRDWKNNAPKPEYDHIIPHSEGGLFTLENIRLLCRACHLLRTKLWHKTRKKKSTS